MSFLRFMKFLSLGMWLGAIIFFGAVLAPTVFKVLPTHTLAGMVVSSSLTKLHWMGIAFGAIFIVVSFVESAASRPRRAIFGQVLLVVIMLALTAYAEWEIGRKMNRLRLDMGQIDQVAVTDPRRVEFNRMHVWSERVEESIFFLGLGALFLSSRRLS